MKTVKETLEKVCNAVFENTVHIHYAVKIDGVIETKLFLFDTNDGVIFELIAPLNNFRLKLRRNAQVLHPNLSDQSANAFRGFFGLEFDSELDKNEKNEMTLEQLQRIFPEATADTWHQHPNGGGWVQNTAKVEENAYVGKEVVIAGTAVVLWNSSISERTTIYGVELK